MHQLQVADDKDKRLRLLEDRSGVVVQGLEEVVVKNAAGEGAGHLKTQSSGALVSNVRSAAGWILCAAMSVSAHCQQTPEVSFQWGFCHCAALVWSPAVALIFHCPITYFRLQQCFRPPQSCCRRPHQRCGPTEIYQVLDRGTSKRRTAETLLNKRSSRSHR